MRSTLIDRRLAETDVANYQKWFAGYHNEENREIIRSKKMTEAKSLQILVLHYLQGDLSPEPKADTSNLMHIRGLFCWSPRWKSLIKENENSSKIRK